ncbi:hypothetical protein [Pseudomonas pseudonitroreducens]|uniref:hypothetical protein n=1 Tax=Pseudomonas pseudonitroreducens TaxID=2892326 RepID=UPI001F397047|nr:hypothetical protein [Pseudomonas pseudonitroreducens]
MWRGLATTPTVFEVAEDIDTPANVSRADTVTQANSVAELIRMLLALRTLRLAYDLLPNPDNFEAWHTHSGCVTETLESLRCSVAEDGAIASQAACDATERVREMAESTVKTTRRVDGATLDLVQLGEDLQQMTRQFRNVD